MSQSVNNKTKIDKIEKTVKANSLAMAIIREDLDAVENDNQRSIILIRKSLQLSQS